MKGKRRLLMGLSLLAIGLVALTALGPGSVRGQKMNDRAKLWINDFAGAALLSDGVNGGWYIDNWLLESPDSDRCVTGWVDNSGFFFIYMDFGQEVGSDCSQSLGIPPRAYTIVPLQGNQTYYSAPNKFRIRSEKLFSKKQTTPIAFMFYNGGISYEVRTDTEVLITKSGNTRTLTYNGTATLWRISQAPIKPVPVYSHFYFPFQITVERVPQ
jgi:hypothetical protein